MSNPSYQQINPALLEKLLPAVRRERWRLVFSFLAITWIALAIVGLIVYLLNQSAQSALDPYLHGAWVWILALGGIGSLSCDRLSLFSPCLQQKRWRTEWRRHIRNWIPFY